MFYDKSKYKYISWTSNSALGSILTGSLNSPIDKCKNFLEVLFIIVKNKHTQKNISGKIVMSIVVELINDGSHTMECYSVIRKKTTSTCNDVDKT